MALIHEKLHDFDKCHDHLEKAKKLHTDNNLDFIYANYCVRVSSYFRYVNELDSATDYAEEALKYATEYSDYLNVSDAHLMLGILAKKDSEIQKSNYHFTIAAQRFQKRLEFSSAFAMYNNISKNHQLQENYELALLYSDSAFHVANISNTPKTSGLYSRRSSVFEQLNELDSAFYYSKLYFQKHKEESENQKAKEIKQITQEFENKKKEQLIKDQQQVNSNQRIILFSLILVIIVIGSLALLLSISRKKIKANQKRIEKQAKALETALEQKEVLMAELQHRVKNNLQMIIGILGLQEGSSNDKSVDTILQESQNRIRSMAILHEKLFESDELSDIDSTSFLQEISDLLQNSYLMPGQQINIHVHAKSHGLNAKNAIPIGLITVEMLSNSFKHAFKDVSLGDVYITLQRSEKEGYDNLLIYKDTGKDVNLDALKNSKGLGLEIISGLVGQLKGEFEMVNENGLKMNIYF